MTVTYDRFLPYFKTIKSIKPSLSDLVKLEILVDSKLPTWKFLTKKLITKLILGTSNYSYVRGLNCIGATRNYMVKNTKSDYVLIVDDDDLLDSSNLEDLLQSFELSKYNLVNFSYSKPTTLAFIEYDGFNKPTWNLWFSGKPRGINVGTSTIFRSSFYNKLHSLYEFKLTKVDDMIPFHVMYHLTCSILSIPINLVIRGRGKSSLMNTTDEIKLEELVYSIKTFKTYLEYDALRSKLENNVIFKIVLSNQIHYHTIKSGTDFTDEILKRLNLSKSDIYDLEKIK